MSIITLTTDYGLKDHFVGAIKGKILSQFIDAKIVDISHDIDAFNCAEASYIIGLAYHSFPKGSIHIIGVDIEQTIENKPIAMQYNDHFFICADNGILSMLTQDSNIQHVVEIMPSQYLPNNKTDIDIFVTIAIQLTKGIELQQLGKPITKIKEITELKPVISIDNNSIKGYVIYIDHFGNVVTNITKRMFETVGKSRDFEIVLNEKRNYSKPVIIKNIVSKYADIAKNGNYLVKNYEGDKLAIFNEAGFLEIAIFRSNPATVGSASTLFGLGYRDVIAVRFLEK